MRTRACAALLAVFLFSQSAWADDDAPPVDVFPSSSAASSPVTSAPKPGTPVMTPSTIKPKPKIASPPSSTAPAHHPLSTTTSSQPAPLPPKIPDVEPAPAKPSTTFTTLDFDFIDVMTRTNAPSNVTLEALQKKLATVALPDRQRDIFGNSPTGPLIVKQIAPVKVQKTAEPVIDLFLQAVHSLQIELISAQDNMAVINGHDLYLGDTLIMQTGAFTTQARVKEIKPTTIVFENPVDHHVTSLTLTQEPDNLEQNTGGKPQSLEDIEGITLQEQH